MHSGVRGVMAGYASGQALDTCAAHIVDRLSAYCRFRIYLRENAFVDMSKLTVIDWTQDFIKWS